MDLRKSNAMYNSMEQLNYHETTKHGHVKQVPEGPSWPCTFAKELDIDE